MLQNDQYPPVGSTAVCLRLEANMTSNLELWVKKKKEQEDNFRAADLFEI